MCNWPNLTRHRNRGPKCFLCVSPQGTTIRPRDPASHYSRATAKGEKWMTKSAWALLYCVERWWERAYTSWRSLRPKVSPRPKHQLSAIYVLVVGIRGIEVCTGFLQEQLSSMVNSLSVSPGDAPLTSCTSTTLSLLTMYSPATSLLSAGRNNIKGKSTW